MAVAVAIFAPFNGWHARDLAEYRDVAFHLFRGDTPYRDFSFEYPPLALLPIALSGAPALWTDWTVPRYVEGVLATNAVWGAALAFCIVLGVTRLRPGTERSGLTRFAALAFAGVALFPWRFDLFPALLTALALLFVLRRSPHGAGCCVGLGAAAKVYPLALMPIMILRHAAERDVRAVRAFVASAAAAMVVPAVVATAVAPSSVVAFLRYHVSRGVQIESVPAGVLMLAHMVGASPLAVVDNFGAIHLASPAVDALRPWFPAAVVAAQLVVAWLAHARFRADVRAHGAVGDDAVAAAACLSILAFILANKVLSPQYMAWLLPFVALLSRVEYALAALATGLTMIIFLFDYDGLVRFEPQAVVLLNIRNAVLIALAIALGRSLWRRRPGALARSGSPVGAS